MDSKKNALVQGVACMLKFCIKFGHIAGLGTGGLFYSPFDCLYTA